MKYRIGLVLQTASTGGWRFTFSLCRGIRQRFPDTQLTVYLGKSVTQTFRQDRPGESLRQLGVAVEKYVPPFPEKHRTGLRHWASMPRRWHRSRVLLRQKAAWELQDLVFFPWPYHLEFVQLDRPTAFLPHDFFYLHFLGSFEINNERSTQFVQDHRPWLESGYSVVSTHFIASELEKTFPTRLRSPAVIHLSRLSQNEAIPTHRIEEILQDLRIEGDFILNINNASHHKNLGQVLTAFYYLTQSFPKLKLVVCGFGTAGVAGRANQPNYIDLQDPNPNVFCLGMLSDCQITALIQRAKLVVNASLYEAGNGSGLDAWSLGTPVAMSNIPPFIEQMNVLGVQATIFNPRCCFEMREAMHSILADPNRAQEMSRVSKAQMEKYTWGDIAEKYMEFFDDSIRDFHMRRGT
jgi:glycosyltransferase involved in cell wall biosynthesis